MMPLDNVAVAVSDGAVAEQINTHLVVRGELRVGAKADVLTSHASNSHFRRGQNHDLSRVSGHIVPFVPDEFVARTYKLF